MAIQLPRSSHRPPPSKYEVLGLRDQPFPANPVVNPYSTDPRSNGSIYATGPVQSEIGKFEDLLIRPDDFTNRSTLAFLWSKGDQYSGRGMGKTALLRYFQQRINVDWGYTEFSGAFSAAVLYTAFPSQVDRRYMEQLAWSALVDLCKGNLLKASRAALRARFLGDLVQAVVMTPEGVEDGGRLLDDETLSAHGVDVESLDRQVFDVVAGAGVSQPVAAAFAGGDFEGYLRGLRKDGNLEPYYMPRDTKGLDLSRSLLFNDVVLYLREAGFSGGYLFIDDIENLVDQMARRQRLEFAKEFGLCTVRPGFANTQFGFFSCVLTTHQQSAASLAQAWTEAGLAQFAKLDPSAPTSIELPLPSTDQARQIVIAHLDFYRIDKSQNGTARPFTDEAMDMLVARNVQPRILLANAQQVVVKAADRGVTEIGPEFVSASVETTVAVTSEDYAEGIDEAL